MIPDIQLQLKAVVKSLKDTVLPAIDKGNELAQQQIQLSMATLEIALNNLPVMHAMLRKDIEQHINMAREMGGALKSEENKRSLQALISTAEQALQDPTQGLTQLQQQARELRSGIGDVISGNAEGADAVALEQIVLAHSEASLTLGRAMNKPMGFEPAPDDIADIAALVDYSRG